MRTLEGIARLTITSENITDATAAEIHSELEEAMSEAADRILRTRGLDNAEVHTLELQELG